jgi:hypothetical protein
MPFENRFPVAAGNARHAIIQFILVRRKTVRRPAIHPPSHRFQLGMLFGRHAMTSSAHIGRRLNAKPKPER